MSRGKGVRGAVAALLLALGAAAQASPERDALLDEARRALETGATGSAWKILSEAEADHAGDVRFDYWLGLVAVRAGEPGRAVFALERVLAEEPRHGGARLELATAWLQLGRREAAAAELDRLEAMSPPAEVRQRIEALNEQLRRQTRRAGRRTLGGYLGVEAGHDDNVGTWPEGLEFFPGATVEALDSDFRALEGAAWYRFDVAADRAVTVSASALLRRNAEDEAEQFDQDYVAARGEYSHDLDGRNEWAAFLEFSGLDLDGERYYRASSLGGEWRRHLSEGGSWRAGAQLRQLDFELDEHDALVTRVHVAQERHLAPRWLARVGLRADYEAADEDRPGGDAVVAGLDGTLLWQLAVHHRLSLAASYARAGYRAGYEAFEAIINPDAESREDDRVSARLQWDWLPGERWLVRASAAWRDQDSSLEAFTYDQTTLAAGLHCYF